MAPVQLRHSFLLVVALASTSCFSQEASHTTASRANPSGASLAIDGYSGEVPIVQVNGRSYLDLEAFSRITNASVRLQGNRLTMTLPGHNAITAAQSAQASTTLAQAGSAASSGFSREYVNANVLAVSALREWRSTLLNAVRSNFPIGNDLTASIRRNAEVQVALAVAAAHNPQDRSAAVLMQNEFANMRTLNATFVSAHDSATNIRTDAMDTDPLSIKTQNCLAALTGLSVGGQFQDVPSCH